MAILFGQLLNMSLTASIMILCVMAARLLLKKAPKIYSYALWAVVLFRLLCPVSLTAPVSVLEIASPQAAYSEQFSYVAYEAVENVLIDSGNVLPKVQEEPISIRELEQKAHDTSPTAMEIVSSIWVAGIAVMLIYSAVTYLRLHRRLIGAMRWRENIYFADHIDSPFVLGLLFPKIYLPSDTPEKERRYIIAHERHHILRFDHIIKLLAYAALCIHWFNPLVWVSFLLAGKDMEMSCDEAVIKKLGEHIRADYSASLLRLATHKKIIAGTPLAFGEGDTKGRVKNMAKWKKPKLWVSLLCAVLCIVVLVICAVNPEKTEEEPDIPAAPEMTGSISSDYFVRVSQLPEGYTHDTDTYGNIRFLRGTDPIGGLTSYAIPEGVYDPSDTSFQWLEEVGIPDYEDDSLRSEYLNFVGEGKEWNVTFTSRVSDGQEPAVQRDHTFYVIGMRAFDCWFDLLQVEGKTCREIRDAVKISDNTASGETEALRKCYGALDAVQSGSSHILLERRYDAGLSDYTQEYLQHHNENHDEWLSIITVQIAGMAEKHANLYADGRYFSNLGKWSEEEILWTEMKTESNPLRPWLTTYQWNKETVAYIDTVPDGSGEFVMLRIDEPFVTRAEEADEHYFVNFYFDSKGGFVKAEITVNPFHEDAYIQTESIVTLENLFVYKEINAEYQRAIS